MGESMKEFIVRKGERHEIVKVLFDSVPDDFNFTVEPLAGDEELTGKVEVTGSIWLFRREPVAHELLPTNSFHKNFWDSYFTIEVIPDQDVRIILDENKFKVINLILVVAGIIVFGAIVSLVFGVLTRLLL